MIHKVMKGFVNVCWTDSLWLPKLYETDLIVYLLNFNVHPLNVIVYYLIMWCNKLKLIMYCNETWPRLKLDLEPCRECVVRVKKTPNIGEPMYFRRLCNFYLITMKFIHILMLGWHWQLCVAYLLWQVTLNLRESKGNITVGLLPPKVAVAYGYVVPHPQSSFVVGICVVGYFVISGLLTLYLMFLDSQYLVEAKVNIIIFDFEE